MNQKLKKKIILNIPYVAIGLFATNLGEAWRIADGINASEKLQGLIIGGGFQNAFTNPRVCQVKCVSSFLHLFPQLSAV